MVIYCNKCGAENPDDSKYCGSCGALISKTNQKEEKIAENNEKKSYNKPLIYGILLIVLLLIVFIPTKTIYETKQEPYQANEEYTTIEPQTLTEIIETRNDGIQDCETREPKYNVYKNLYEENGELILTCEVQNLENSEIRVTLGFYLYDNEGQSRFSRNNPEYVNQPISANSLILKKKNTGLDLSKSEVTDYGCDVYPIEDVFCKITNEEPILKEVQVTRDVEVVKTRQVTKYKDVSIPKKVNWLLGFSLPWN